ncbi:MAG: NUDIX hydrolase [Hyphomicrobiaceae bacterium]|nr:NUDIX hydrolase [Hyphomicrobiaceae bacterium]
MAKKKTATKRTSGNKATPRRQSKKKKVTIHSSERKFDGFLKIDAARVSYERYDGGTNKEQTFLVLERGDAAAALLHDTDRDTIILAEQFRYPTYQKGPGWLMETVAGGIGTNETAEECIKREIMEEIGYQANDFILISEFYVSPGGSSERIFLFYVPVRSCDLVNRKAAGRKDEREDICRVEIPVMTFFRALDRGDYKDAKTIIAGHWYRRKRALWRRRNKSKGH